MPVPAVCCRDNFEPIENTHRDPKMNDERHHESRQMSVSQFTLSKKVNRKDYDKHEILQLYIERVFYE